MYVSLLFLKHRVAMRGQHLQNMFVTDKNQGFLTVKP